MKYGTKEINWAELGAMMAHEGDKDQSDFFNAFCKELRKACFTHYNCEMQMGCIQNLLAKADREMLALLGPDESK